jgi:hypothetical protein
MLFEFWRYRTSHAAAAAHSKARYLFTSSCFPHTIPLKSLSWLVYRFFPLFCLRFILWAPPIHLLSCCYRRARPSYPWLAGNTTCLSTMSSQHFTRKLHYKRSEAVTSSLASLGGTQVGSDTATEGDQGQAKIITDEPIEEMNAPMTQMDPPYESSDDEADEKAAAEEPEHANAET